MRHSKALLERNEKVALSQVHQARTDTRINLNASLLALPNLPKLYSIWGNPEAVDGLSEEEAVLVRMMMTNLSVAQDNVLYQVSLGLADPDAKVAAQTVIAANYLVWKKLRIELTSRIELCYREMTEENANGV